MSTEAMNSREEMLESVLLVLAFIDLMWVIGPYYSGRDAMVSIPVVFVVTFLIAILMVALRHERQKNGGREE